MIDKNVVCGLYKTYFGGFKKLKILTALSCLLFYWDFHFSPNDLGLFPENETNFKNVKSSTIRKLGT